MMFIVLGFLSIWTFDDKDEENIFKSIEIRYTFLDKVIKKNWYKIISSLKIQLSLVSYSILYDINAYF